MMFKADFMRLYSEYTDKADRVLKNEANIYKKQVDVLLDYWKVDKGIQNNSTEFKTCLNDFNRTKSKIEDIKTKLQDLQSYCEETNKTHSKIDELIKKLKDVLEHRGIQEIL